MKKPLRHSLIVDRFGKPMASSLYPTPNSISPYRNRPRQYLKATDISTQIDCCTHTSQVAHSRGIYAQVPSINSVINTIARRTAGKGWTPVFRGENSAWGEEASNWLKQNWFPVANAAGGQYDFRTSLTIAATSVLVDGDVLMVFQNGLSGYPQINFVASHRIGQRTAQEKEVTNGSYKGLRLFNGVIVNKVGRPVAFRILGDSEENDYDLSAQNCRLIYDPSYFGQYRGIPRIAVGLQSCLDVEDIEWYMRRLIQIESMQKVIHKTPSGEVEDEDAQSYGTYTGTTARDTTADTLPPLPVVRTLDSDIQVISSDGDITSYQTDRPHANAVSYIERVEHSIIASLGWSRHLVDYSKTGGAPHRSVLEECQNFVDIQQQNLTQPIKLAVNFALVKAMQDGLITDNFDSDWWNWSWLYPSSLTADSGYDREADRKDLDLGIITEQMICAKYGRDYKGVRKERKVEVDNLLKDAAELQKLNPQYSLDFIFNLIRQTSPNGVPLTQPVNTTKAI